LKMFVLRAKCELTDASGQFHMQGLLGSAAQDAAITMNLIAAGAHSIRASSQKDSEIMLLLPPGWLASQAVPRLLHLRQQEVSAEADSKQIAVWNAMEISSGIARLSAAVSEAFVPQMLNYESVGGVNFKKGCYPGQEVVARSQFRGTLKRRGYIVTSETALQAGQEVFDGREPEQPSGLIAQAAAHPSGGFIAIVSMQIAAQDSPALHAGSADGAKLVLQALPYALLEDI
jgi:tRNA-modifying protein YgfZ